MRQREERIAELIRAVAEKSHDFANPPMAVIGGYALRAYIPFSYGSRQKARHQDLNILARGGAGEKGEMTEKEDTKVMLAVQGYKRNQISIGRAAGIAGLRRASVP